MLDAKRGVKHDWNVWVLGKQISQEHRFDSKLSLKFNFIFFGKLVKNHLIIMKCHLNYSELTSVDKNMK